MRKPSPLLLKRCKFGEIISCMAAGCFSSTLIPYRSEGISARHTARPSSCCSEVAPNQTPPSAIKQGLLSWKALTVHPIKPPKPGPCRLVAGVHKAALTACLTQGLVTRSAPRCPACAQHQAIKTAPCIRFCIKKKKKNPILRLGTCLSAKTYSRLCAGHSTGFVFQA